MFTPGIRGCLILAFINAAWNEIGAGATGIEVAVGFISPTPVLAGNVDIRGVLGPAQEFSPTVICCNDV